MLVVGAVWGAWHVPLFFLAGTGQHEMGLLSIQGALFFVALFPLSYSLLFVSERLRGGVWAAIAFHASWNLTSALMPALGDGGAFVEAALMFAVAGCAAWASGSGRRRTSHEVVGR